MHVLLLSYTFWPPDFGGELLITIERAKSLVKKGIKISFLTSGHPKYPSLEEVEGLKIYRSPAIHDSRIGRVIRRLIFIFWSLHKLIVLNFDILHFGSLPGIGRITNALIGKIFIQISHLKKSKCVIVHSLADTDQNPLDLSGLAGKIYGLFLKGVDEIVGVSPFLYKAIKKKFPQQAKLICNGIRDDIFQPLANPERSHLREANQISPDNIIFIFLGTVGTRKGFDLVAKAFAELSLQYSAWRLWVVGPCNTEESKNIVMEDVNDVIKPLHGNKKVTFWGRLNDQKLIAKIFGASDVFVFPTRREGMPLAPMEAMAVGLPLIISKIPGVTDLANIEGETGYYIAPGNLFELMQAMEKLGTDEELRHRLGIRARGRVLENFVWGKHIDQWEYLYRSLGNR